MGITAAFGAQYRKPTGLFGRLIGHQMAVQHRGLTDWAIEWLDPRPGDRLLDLGCGSGQAVKRLSERVPQGFVAGIDYSDLMVAMAREANSAAIASGRVEVRGGVVSKLPYADGSFTGAASLESFYYFPDPISDLREVLRVLRPGGRFVLVLEWSKDMPNVARIEPLAVKMNCPLFSGEELTQLLTQAGYSQVGFEFRPEGNWLRARGLKPA